MTWTNRTPVMVLTGVALLGLARPVTAQMMSTWGHPVVTFGWTPYDSVNTGHGNYPGSPGFIPGYGYYPGSGPGHYPWLDGPGTPFDRRKIETAFPSDASPGAAVAPESPPPGKALIIVKIAAEAELSFDGAATTQGGSYRRFLTPDLPAGRTLSYTMRARWLIKGVELTRVEEVRVQAGGTFTVNFLTSESWTGRRLPTLPAPKPLPSPTPQVSTSAIPDQ
jgi:uncharacterized protein (TIGR03000 family)